MIKNLKSLIVWLILGIAGITTFILYFSQAFPLASLDVKIDRKEAIKLSSDFIKNQGFNLNGFDKAVIFRSDYYASSYLQQTQGLKRANELIRKDALPVWFWRVRWFKELEKEGFIVDIDPSQSKIVRFDYYVLEDKEGEDLSKRKAMMLAVEKVRFQGVDLSNYELKDTAVEKQKNRTDYTFKWERKNYSVDEATLRLNVQIYGDQLGCYYEYLKVPETFQRYVEGQISLGKILKTITLVLTFILVMTAIFALVLQKSLASGHWKFWLAAGAVVFFLKLLDFFNSLPLIWFFYYDTVSKGIFFVSSLGEYLSAAISLGVMIFAYGLLGELFLSAKDNSLLFKVINKKTISASKAISTIVVSYSLSFICLGYLALFYSVGGKIFNIWMPLKSEYANILCKNLPFLFPLTLAAIAAIYEELAYRLFATSFLKRYIKIGWLAILIPALLWGLVHSFNLVFPVYVRCIELTLLGVLFGVILFKYGIGVVITAHFLINVILVGMPFWRSHNPTFFGWGIGIIILTLLPALIILFMFNASRKKIIRD